MATEQPVTDPVGEAAFPTQLHRGMLKIFGAPDATRHTDPDVASASFMGLLRAIFHWLKSLVSDGTTINVQGSAIVVTLTPTASTSAYVDGDIFFDLTEVLNAVLAAGDTCYVQSITVIDKDAEGLALDIYVAQGSTSLGTVSSAPSISDANIVANVMQRLCQFATSDYTTLNGAKIASIGNLAFPVKTSGSTSFWLGAIARSGATLSSTSDIVVLVGIARK